MRLAAMKEAGKRVRVRVEQWASGTVYFNIAEILPEDASDTQKLMAVMYENRTGTITRRGKVESLRG